jgi:hypothetical protein
MHEAIAFRSDKEKISVESRGKLRGHKRTQTKTTMNDRLEKTQLHAQRQAEKNEEKQERVLPWAFISRSRTRSYVCLDCMYVFVYVCVCVFVCSITFSELRATAQRSPHASTYTYTYTHTKIHTHTRTHTP